MLRMVPLPRHAGEDHGEIVPQLILPRLRGRGTGVAGGGGGTGLFTATEASDRPQPLIAIPKGC